MRFVGFVLSAAILAGAMSATVVSAQIPGTPKSDQAIEMDTPIIKTSVTNLVAPVLVTDKDGNIVDGLQPNQFHLWDNG